MKFMVRISLCCFWITYWILTRFARMRAAQEVLDAVYFLSGKEKYGLFVCYVVDFIFIDSSHLLL